MARTVMTRKMMAMTMIAPMTFSVYDNTNYADEGDS
jgi:hypothetical protein